MKNFKFNLEPLLRLKDVEKRKIELELANCQLEIENHHTQIDSENNSIKDMLSEAENSVVKNGTVISLMSIPSILEVKKKNIKLLQDQLGKLEIKQKEILSRLNIKNSEIKNIEERKTEKLKEYKKEIEHIQEENMSDLYKSIIHRRKSGVVI